jgi:coproporphyrinogen III oxidase
MSKPDRHDIELAYKQIQSAICASIAAEDGGAEFTVDQWQRPEGGGGITRILQAGNVLEKAGVNFSAVEGKLSPLMQKNLNINADDFFATGVSIVMHPYNPHVPIIHMNIRYFETSDGQYWFGGGIDLTPHYVVPGQAAWFHKQLLKVCNDHDPEYYQRFKKWADEYFFIPHRNETRGIGGIFYDHLHEDSTHSKLQLLNFSLALGNLFPELYCHLIRLNRDKPYTSAEKEWQLIRRGRYVEFNLVYDRGTRFGLVSNGRVESILMSLPAEARWQYDHKPADGSAEANTLAQLIQGIDWATSDTPLQ